MCPESDCPMPMCINIAALIAAEIGRSLKVGRGCVILDHIVPLVWSGGTYSTSTDSANGTKLWSNTNFLWKWILLLTKRISHLRLLDNDTMSWLW